MQPAASRADELGQPSLDIHMDVFESLAERKGSGGDFRFDMDQALLDLLFVGHCDNAGRRQHGGVSA